MKDKKKYVKPEIVLIRKIEAFSPICTSARLPKKVCRVVGMPTCEAARD